LPFRNSPTASSAAGLRVVLKLRRARPCVVGRKINAGYLKLAKRTLISCGLILSIGAMLAAYRPKNSDSGRRGFVVAGMLTGHELCRRHHCQSGGFATSTVVAT
jgi:hypothetical protein